MSFFRYCDLFCFYIIVVVNDIARDIGAVEKLIDPAHSLIRTEPRGLWIYAT